MTLTTAAKSKIYFEPKELWLTLDAGSFKKLIYDTSSGEIELVLNEKTKDSPEAYLRSNKELDLKFDKMNGAYKIPLKKKSISISIE